MEDKINKLNTIKKSAIWQILKLEGHDMNTVRFLGDKFAETPLLMRLAGSLVLPLEVVLPDQMKVKLIHPWESHGASQDDINFVFLVDLRDIRPITVKEVPVYE